MIAICTYRNRNRFWQHVTPPDPHGLAQGRLVGTARSHRANGQARRNQALRIMTKEFLPGLKGTHRLTHDMSIPHGGSPAAKAAKPREDQDRPDQHGSGQSGKGAHAAVPKWQAAHSRAIVAPSATSETSQDGKPRKAKGNKTWHACWGIPEDVPGPHLRRRARNRVAHPRHEPRSEPTMDAKKTWQPQRTPDIPKCQRGLPRRHRPSLSLSLLYILYI